MIYGYIRVSTDKQTAENQRFEIKNFCLKNEIFIDGWISETISGTKTPDKRKLGKLLKRLNPGDTVICTEISRLGRNLFMVMEILNICMEKNCRVWTIKDGYRLGDDIQSKVLAFAFGLSAEIERNLLSQRTKEALARLKSEGKHLGRPVGYSTPKMYKLYGKEKRILNYMKEGLSYAEMGRRLKCDRGTVRSFVLVFIPEHSDYAYFKPETWPARRASPVA